MDRLVVNLLQDDADQADDRCLVWDESWRRQRARDDETSSRRAPARTERLIESRSPSPRLIRFDLLKPD
jgi:hypothetical protein